MTITLLIITWTGMLAGKIVPKKHGMLGSIILSACLFPAVIAGMHNPIFLSGLIVLWLSYEITRDR